MDTVKMPEVTVIANVAFMSKIQQSGTPPVYLSTHPSDETRIAQIKKWLPEAMTYYNKK